MKLTELNQNSLTLCFTQGVKSVTRHSDLPASTMPTPEAHTHTKKNTSDELKIQNNHIKKQNPPNQQKKLKRL